MSESCIFCRIIRGEIPSYKIYEDEKTLAFLDLNPSAPGHTLIIPKAHVPRVEDLSEEDVRLGDDECMASRTPWRPPQAPSG